MAKQMCLLSTQHADQLRVCTSYLCLLLLGALDVQNRACTVPGFLSCLSVPCSAWSRHGTVGR